jgi:hypothetical protein
MLTRDAILQQTQLPVEAVEAFGGVVHVRTLMADERDAYERAFLDAKAAGKPFSARGLMAAMAVCDAGGQRLFGAGDGPALGKLSSKELDKIFAVATKLNGLGKDDVEELAKNSDATTGDDSSLS